MWLALSRDLEVSTHLSGFLHVLAPGDFHLAVPAEVSYSYLLLKGLGQVAQLLLVAELRLFLSNLGDVCDGNELLQAHHLGAVDLRSWVLVRAHPPRLGGEHAAETLAF